MMKEIIVKNTINSPVDKVWKLWTLPEHITQWYNASDDWHTPKAENDLREGGQFLFRMEAKDGSFGFDFEGTYDEIISQKRITYTLTDGRKVKITFTEHDGMVEIIETFEAESQNSIDMQQQGWQAILDNFKAYAEGNK